MQRVKLKNLFVKRKSRMKTFQQFQENTSKLAIKAGKIAAKKVSPVASAVYGVHKLPKLKKNLEKK